MYKSSIEGLLKRRYVLNPSAPKNISYGITISKNTNYMILYAGSGVIDWGDGTVEELQYTPSGSSKTHTYTPGSYVIIITGNITRIYPEYNYKLYTTIAYNYNLDSINYYPSYSSYGAFGDCIHLTTIDDDFTISPNINSCAFMFSSCSKLTSLPSNFKLPSSLSKFLAMFLGCSNLTSLPSSFFPTFTSTDIDIYSMFSGCTSLTGTIPADKLWERTDIAWDATKAFEGCTKLSNYSEIPSTWK